MAQSDLNYLFETQKSIITDRFGHCPKQLQFNVPGFGFGLLLIPNYTTLCELMVFPMLGSPDPHHLEFYRKKHKLRPQVTIHSNQKLLMSRSDLVVGWIASCWQSPSDFALAEKEWCKKHSVNYALVTYFRTVVMYCKLILPEIYTNPDKDNKIIDSLNNSNLIYKDDGMVYHDENKVRENSGEANYFDKKRSRHFSLGSRHCEYRTASYHLGRMEASPRWRSLASIQNDNIQKRISAENRAGERLRSSGDFDGRSRILTQCIACYGFREQEPTNQLSRFCSDCEKDIRGSWRKLITRKGITEGHVPLNGFYGGKRLTDTL